MKHLMFLTMALLLGSTLSVYATDGTDNREDDDWQGIPVDTPDGIEVLDEHPAFFECIEQSTSDQILGGSVPPTNSCEHGIFVRSGPSTLHGFVDIPYQENEWTGIMQSWLKWAGQNRGFQCTFDQGELVEGSCEVLGGVFPSQGERFIQECLAFDPYGHELEVALTEFGCMVRGDIELE